jgi:hypothetical protein
MSSASKLRATIMKKRSAMSILNPNVKRRASEEREPIKITDAAAGDTLPHAWEAAAQTRAERTTPDGRMLQSTLLANCRILAATARNARASLAASTDSLQACCSKGHDGTDNTTVAAAETRDRRRSKRTKQYYVQATCAKWHPASSPEFGNDHFMFCC